MIQPRNILNYGRVTKVSYNPIKHRKLLIGCLGERIGKIRVRLDIAKNQVEVATAEWDDTSRRLRGGVNHGLIQRLEKGENHAIDYETLWRFIEGANTVSERGKISARERLDLFQSNFYDRMRYEAAKFLVYRIYLDMHRPEAPDVLPLPLEELRHELIDAGFGGKTFIGKGVRTPDVPERLDSARGFRAVRIMAELQEAHPYRVALLEKRRPYLIADWTNGVIMMESEETGEQRDRKILDFAPTAHGS